MPGDERFQYLDEAGQVHRVSSADVNAWLLEQLGPGMTAKVFRTWHGSVLALDLVLAAALQDQAPDLPALVRQVAQRLGHTPAVCRASSLHPAVLLLGAELVDPARRRGLSQTEAQLLAMLAAARPGPAAEPRARTTA
ncbi:hypothetical protein [Roseateles flavus]|uniref:DNA topoisomerase I catalytic core eukaryotic-type domain-containing protein n=1 Tax=Roseateles flavus TaxID=3149041 RepID=A0ABV0GGK8_9BURK